MHLLELIGDTLIITGEIMIIYMVISVHSTIRAEHRFDKKVFLEMEREQVIGILSISFLVLGFLLRVLGRHIL